MQSYQLPQRPDELREEVSRAIRYVASRMQERSRSFIARLEDNFSSHAYTFPADATALVDTKAAIHLYEKSSLATVRETGQLKEEPLASAEDRIERVLTLAGMHSYDANQLVQEFAVQHRQDLDHLLIAEKHAQQTNPEAGRDKVSKAVWDHLDEWRDFHRHNTLPPDAEAAAALHMLRATAVGITPAISEKLKPIINERLQLDRVFEDTFASINGDKHRIRKVIAQHLKRTKGQALPVGDPTALQKMEQPLMEELQAAGASEGQIVAVLKPYVNARQTLSQRLEQVVQQAAPEVSARGESLDAFRQRVTLHAKGLYFKARQKVESEGIEARYSSAAQPGKPSGAPAAEEQASQEKAAPGEANGPAASASGAYHTSSSTAQDTKLKRGEQLAIGAVTVGSGLGGVKLMAGAKPDDSRDAATEHNRKFHKVAGTALLATAAFGTVAALKAKHPVDMIKSGYKAAASWVDKGKESSASSSQTR